MRGDTHGPDVSVILVTYECAGLVPACLDALDAAVRAHRYEVVAVDNGSTDGSADAVIGALPGAVVVEMGRNLGFARAVNAAAARATGRYLLLLNPDTEAAPGAVDELVRVADAHPRVGVVAPRLVGTDGRDQATARSFPTPAAALLGRRSPLTRRFPRNRWSSRYLAGRDHRGGEPFAVDWVSGACLLTPRSLADELGGLDPGFFMHFEDADYCHRVKAAGRSVMCVPSAVVVHHEGGCRRGWPVSQVRHFHHGAYRYWTKHHAPGRANPLRALAAAALAARATGVVLVGRLAAVAAPGDRWEPRERTA
jgi:GT2 family glycosyltransferase